MNSNEIFWDSDMFDVGSTVELPKTVLDEQAEAMSSLTNGVLLAKVQQKQDGESINFNFFVCAPRMGNYEAYLFNVYQPIMIFPCSISSRFTPTVICNDIDIFKRKLKDVLQNSEIKRTVRALFLQSIAD